jgi:PTS system galactitol-specific IIC component
VSSLEYVGMGILSLITIVMVFFNRRRIVAEEKNSK